MRLLFTSMPIHSHISPTLPLATAAREAGHEVLFVTGSDAVRYPQAAGLPTAPAGLTLPESAGRYRRAYSAEELAALSPDERIKHLTLHWLMEIAAVEMVDEVISLVREWEPDLIVTTLAEGAGVVAAALSEIPFVIHAFGPPKAAAFAEAKWKASEELVKQRGGTGLLSRDAVPYLDIWPTSMRPSDLEWAYPQMWPLRPEGILPVPGAERPSLLDALPFGRTVYVTLGTSWNSTPGAMETMVEAVSDQGVNVVVTIGRDADRNRLGVVPAHVRIEEFVPQEQLLPYVDAVVCHGGAGTVLGAVAHGVPLVMSPLASDQHEIAAYAEGAGVGILTSSLTVGSIQDGLRAVLGEDSFRESAASIAEQISAMPTPVDMVTHLEQYGR